MRHKVTDFITWEKVAISVMGLSVALAGYVGSGIVNELSAVQQGLNGLNGTLSELKTQIALSTQSHVTSAKRVDELVDRIRALEQRG